MEAYDNRYKYYPADVGVLEKATLETCKGMLVELSRGLAHPARVEIVRMLAHKPPEARCICGDIVNTLPLAQSSVSQHLKVLKETGWIQGEIDGSRVCYCLVDGVMEFYKALIGRFIQNK
ncbi:MAG: metalloregulator ArsR/SmtB family transcription factor [Syntrophales bacterium]|nr:metalloregulator ArsR/SmtB family transcription factor [Syntrophales bacterium]